MEKMRAQGYDGASNMAGKFRGVQAIVKERVPLATYVHCKAHQQNLSLVYSSSEPCVRTMMATVQDIAVAFGYSAKRLDAFADELETDKTVKENMERRTKLKTLCETRWFSRADALYTYKTAFPVVVNSLEYLKDNNDDKVGQYLSAILRFEFIIALVVAEHILSGTVALTTFLQGTKCDLVEAISESRVVVKQLRDERNDPAVWQALYDNAVEIAEEFEIHPWVPFHTGRQIHRANHPLAVPLEYWKVSL